MACLTPYYKKDKHLMSWMALSCGKCYNCKLKRTQQWVFRLKQELKVSWSAYFVTLTYSDRAVPYDGNGEMTLFHPDIQLFLKGLRKANKVFTDKETDFDWSDKDTWNKKGKLKYYLAGEYGEKTMRPHYHMILFNMRNVKRVGKDLYKSKEIRRLWNKGIVHIGSFSSDSAAYCIKYIDKEKQIPAFPGDLRKEEYNVSSKGIGQYFVTEDVKKFFEKDLKNYVMDGKNKVAMPRYYRDRLFTEGEKRQQKTALIVPKHDLLKKVKREWQMSSDKRNGMSFDEYKSTRIIGTMKKSDNRRKIRE